MSLLCTDGLEILNLTQGLWNKRTDAAFLQKGQKQLNTEEASCSRLVTEV